MIRENIQDLVAFVAVAEEGGFTRAAAKLGVTQSALSQAMRNLEARLGVRLLARTTRRVATTEAGEKLLVSIRPRFAGLENDLAELNELREKPAGTFRITTTEYPAATIIFPQLAKFLPQYPDIAVEVVVDYGLTDIVSQHFDAGVRSGELVEKDMIAVRIGPDITSAVVATPEYFATHGVPRSPRELPLHNCINFRLASRGSLYAWEFKKGRTALNVSVRGQVIVNSTSQMIQAILSGCGLGIAPHELVAEHIQSGKLKAVLSDWCSPVSGFHLYYPNRHQSSKAFRLVVDALRYNGPLVG